MEPGSLVLLKSKNWPTNSFFNFPTLSIKYEVGNLVPKIYLSKNCSLSCFQLCWLGFEEMFLAIQIFPFVVFPSPFLTFLNYKVCFIWILQASTFTWGWGSPWRSCSFGNCGVQFHVRLNEISQTHIWKKNGTSYKHLVLHKFMMNLDCGSKMKHWIHDGMLFLKK